MKKIKIINKNQGNSSKESFQIDTTDFIKLEGGCSCDGRCRDGGYLWGSNGKSSCSC